MDNNQGMEEKHYALSGKIMLSAIVVLFFVIILMVILHLYARWYLLRARRRQNHIRRMRQQRRGVPVVLYNDLMDMEAPNNTSSGLEGLDAATLKSLPVFVYSSKTHSEPIDCAVCLSEFEENETGRVLPRCKHYFHIDCIDMWFHSHSTCPLCRSTIEPTDTQLEMVFDVDKPEINEPRSGFGCYSECQYETAMEEDNSAAASSSSSIDDSRKASTFVGISIEVPRRNWSIGRSEDEHYRSDSPTTQRSLRSPMSRMFSFKRMLSREQREKTSSVSPSPAIVMDCSSVSNPDAEQAAQILTRRIEEY